ncbi:MAG TPA: long-chain fatty acid--CoA ligase [Cytophagales bacterium]|nr:long-chain fatty acid--CoA ligase [Cytophagales bacterium]
MDEARNITREAIDFKRLFDLIGYQQEKYPNPTALNYFDQGQWKSLSIHELQDRVNGVACWFIENGFQKGDKVILVPHIGRPEWMIIDFACQQTGLIVVPVHPNLQDTELKTILDETKAKLCLCIAQDIKPLIDFLKDCGASTAVYQIDTPSTTFFKPLAPHAPDAQSLNHLHVIKAAVQEEDIACIMYTSGSSGEPKGVMLTHANIVSNLKSGLTFFPLAPGDKVLSFLPFSHILERAINYAYLAFGTSIYYSHSRESFADDFASVRPVFCTSVPRVLEKMYDYLQQQLLSNNIVSRKLIRWAIELGKKYKERERISFIYGIQLFIARLLVLYRWRKRLGGKIRYMVVGAATLRAEIGRLMAASGIQVVEGYGLTETSPLISINRFEPGLNRFGTVGLVVPGVEILIVDTDEEDAGEILVKGPNVMKGYFNKPALTQEAFTTDGWFRTGDIGKIVDQRFLKITDRKKEIFKTSTGKYIAPQPLQNHFAQSPFIQRCLILGFQKPFVTALIVPHFEILEAWCKSKAIHWTSPEFMIHNIKVINHFKAEIDALNTALPNFRQVRGFVLCAKDWSADEGEITHTMKPVRRVLENNYETEINKMYSKLTAP